MRARARPRRKRPCRSDIIHKSEDLPMKYCRFQTKEGPQYGEVVDRNGKQWIERLIAPPPEDAVQPRSSRAFDAIPLHAATLLAPVTPSKIVCVGRNYMDHARELGNEPP